MTTTTSEPSPRGGVAEDWIVRVVGDVARPRRNIPSTRALGHLPGEGGLIAGLRTIYGMFEHGNASFLEKQRRFGDLCRTSFGPDALVLVFDPEHVFRILRNEDGIWSAALGWRVLFDRIDTRSDTLDMLGSLDFAPHQDARRLLQPAFGNAAITGYIKTALDEFTTALPSFRGRVSFKAAVRRVFAGVAGRIFIGVDDPVEIAMLDQSMARFWGASMAAIKKPMLSRAWRLGVRAYADLFDMLRARVDERRRGPERDDLFTRLCKLPSDTAWIDDDTLVRLFIGVMVAAFDTTSFAVSSMAHLLAEHPAWQDRLREECRRIPTAALGRSEIDALEKMDLVWKETLRLFPIAPDTPRRCLKDTDVGGHRIPAGTMMLPMVGPLLSHPAWWKAPEKFDPERFSPDRAEHKKHRGLYLPFGAGAHTCIGAQLAAVEAKVFFHLLLSSVRFRRADARPRHHQFRPLGQVSGPVDLVFEQI